jgi:hypothetical protein
MDMTEAGSREPLVEGIAMGLADAEGCDVAELDYALADYIDTDALSSLSIGPWSDWRLTFDIAGHTVIVDSEGFVSVDGTQRHCTQSG